MLKSWPVKLDLEYLGHGRYALYIDGDLYQEYENFMEAIIEFEERSEYENLYESNGVRGGEA
jgi:hypothetical protein